MGVPRQLTQVAFAAGLDESQQDEVLDPMAAFPVLRNVRQDKRGGVSKRLGFEQHSKARLSGSRQAGNRLLSRNGEACTIDSTSELDALGSGSAWVVRGRVPEAQCSVHPIPAPGSTNYVEDIAYLGSYLCVAYLAETTTAGSYSADLALYNSSTFATILPPESIDTAINDVAVVTFGSYFVAVVGDETANEVRAYYLDTTSSATLVTGWVLIDTLAVDYAQGLSVESLTDKGIVVYASTTANTVGLVSFDETGVLQTDTTTASGAVTFVDVASNGASTLWVAWTEDVDTVACETRDTTDITDTTSAVATPITLATAVDAISVAPTASSTTATLIVNAGLQPEYMQIQPLNLSGGLIFNVGSARTVQNCGICSRAVDIAGRVYAHVWSGDYNGSAQQIQQQIVLADLTEDLTWVRPVAVPTQNLAVGPNQFSTSRATAGSKPKFAGGIAANQWFSVIGIRRGGTANAAAILEYDFESRARWRSDEIANSLVISSGCLSYYDGSRVAEVGFLYRPPRPTTAQTGTGQTTTLGGWVYVAVYVEVDGAGNRNISGVSDPSASTGNFTNKSINVTTSPLTVTSRMGDGTGTSSVQVEIYRTLDGGEPPYYYVDTLANDTTTASLTLTDGTSDATLETRALLYGTGNLPGTNGAGQDHRAPPCTQDVVAYGDMAVFAHRSNVGWTGQVIEGEGLWTSPLFLMPVPGPGDVVRLLVLDGSVYVFKADRIFVTAGDAPSDNAASGGLGPVRLIAADVGCIEPNSVVATSLGIFFQSHRGIELLSRNGSVIWIGEKVQETLASYPIVTSAVLDDINSLVRITLTDTEAAGLATGDGRTLVYDLTLQTWQSVDDIYGTGANEAAQDAMMLSLVDRRVYAWLATDGYVYYEAHPDSATAHLDPSSTWVTMAAETAWWKPSGIQGRVQLNRVLAMMRKSSDFDVAMSLAYNYDTSYESARTWTHAEIAGLLTDGWPITQLKHEPHDDAECQSFRIKLTDATPTAGTVGSGKGATWLALTMDVTPQAGAFEVPEDAA
jgi:hypothetical protein